MQSPSVVSNGTKGREDETVVLAGSREVALSLPIDLGAAFRLRNGLLGEVPSTSQVAFGCISRRWGDTGRLRCHPVLAYAATGFKALTGFSRLAPFRCLGSIRRLPETPVHTRQRDRDQNPAQDPLKSRILAAERPILLRCPNGGHLKVDHGSEQI